MEACARACRVPPAVEERFSGRVWDCWGRAWSFAALPAVSEDRNLPFPGRLSFAALPAVSCRGLERACVCRLSDTAVFLQRPERKRIELPGEGAGNGPGLLTDPECWRSGMLAGPDIDRAGIRTGRPVAPNEGAGRSCREKLPDLTVGQLPGEDFCERPGRPSCKTVEAAGRRRTGNDSASGRIRAASGAAPACRGRKAERRAPLRACLPPYLPALFARTVSFGCRPGGEGQRPLQRLFGNRGFGSGDFLPYECRKVVRSFSFKPGNPERRVLVIVAQ